MTAVRSAVLEPLIASTTAGMLAPDAVRTAALLDELVTEWDCEAGSDGDAPAVLDRLRRDFEVALAGKLGVSRLDAVLAEVLDRRIRRLGAQTFELGKRLIDGAVARDDARIRALAMMTDIEAVAADVRALTDVPARTRLGRDLQEVSMEALFAIEGQAMSLRLSHHASDAQLPPLRVF